MITLTDFLLTCIAEDEADARAAAVLSLGVDRISTHTLPEFAEHVRRWQPNRVLAECEAKRQIVAEHDPVDHNPGAWCNRCGDRDEWPCPTMAALASVYADRPDFDPAWRIA